MTVERRQSQHSIAHFAPSARRLQHVRVAEPAHKYNAAEALPRDTATQLVVHVHVSQFHILHSLHYLALFVRSTLVRCVVGHT